MIGRSWFLFGLSILMTSALADEVIKVHAVPVERQNELRLLGDFWYPNWREDHVVMLVTERGRAAVEALGYAVESFPEETARLEAFRGIDRQAWLLSGVGGIPGFSCYRTVSETHQDLSELAQDYPDLARWEVIGQTWQQQNGNPDGDNVHVLVIANQNSPWPQAPLLVMAAQHSRELVTAEVATRFAEFLVTSYASNPEVQWLLDHRQIHIVAQQNPDGRRQVEDQETFWRKNYNATACPQGTPGVDLNRNSGFLFGNSSSGNTCSEIYRGTMASSEPETQAIETYMETVFDRQRPFDPKVGPDLTTPSPTDAEGIFISIHSSGEFVLFPWEGLGGGNQNNAPNHDGLTLLARKFAWFTNYLPARWQTLGPAGGTTVDYAYAEFGVAAYTLELGTSFFQPCSSFESTVWPDNFELLMYAARAARRPYQVASGPVVTDPVGQWSAQGFELNGQADDTRFFQGTITEPPEENPVFAIAEVVATLGVPLHLAGETYPLTINGSGPQVSFSGTIPASAFAAQQSLVFVTAIDSVGNTGVPTVLKALKPAIFSDQFEQESAP